MRWILGLAFGVLCSTLFSPAAHAVEVRVKGVFEYSFVYVDNGNFYDHGWDQQSEDQFHARQRTRIQVDFVASESLRGIYFAEIGEIQWGRPLTTGRGSGGALGADGVNIETRRAFVEFVVPDTSLTVRVGVQMLSMPDIGWGNTLLHHDVAGVLASYELNDMVTLSLFWTRLFDVDGNTITSPSSPTFEEFDLAGFILPVKGDGWALTPYGAFGVMGGDLTTRLNAVSTLPLVLSPAHAAGLLYGGPAFTSAYLADQDHFYTCWLGTTFALTMYDPITIEAHVEYGSVTGQHAALDRKGFFAAAKLDYALDLLTISLGGWYATGEDGSWRNGSEQLPGVGFSKSFAPTTFAYDGSDVLPKSPIFSQTPAGKWAIRAALEDIGVWDALTHDLVFLYSRGTNHPNSRRIGGLTAPNQILGYKNTYNAAFVVPPGFFTQPGPTTIPGIDLTTDDFMVEVNFNHQYKVYENLSLILELAMVHVQYGNDLWVHADTSTAWQTGVGLKYQF